MISAPNIRQDRPTSHHWWIEYRLEIVIVIVGAFVTNLIFIARAFRETGTVDRAAAGQLGDFVGGYVGTLFALIGVVLLFATLRNQRSAAQHQNFENKYFELLKLHRDNVGELQLQRASGRRLFVLLIRELRSILDIVRRVGEQHRQILDKRQLIHVAYYCLFFGTVPNSSRMLKTSLVEFAAAFVEALNNELYNPEVRRRVKSEQQLGYTPTLRRTPIPSWALLSSFVSSRALCGWAADRH